MSNIIIQNLKAELTFKRIITQNPQLRKILDRLEKTAILNVSILLVGETGTGKDLCAQSIHFMSSRHDKPFIVYNCGAGPTNFFESTLFGHCKGAFTNALADKRGLIEDAHTGVLFLDEINSLDLDNQVKLNHFLVTGEFRRLGENKIRKVDTRIIMATNKPLALAVEQGKFREDLYYRITEYVINIPPLRERGEDIPLLMNYFLEKYKNEFDKPMIQFTELAYQKAQHYHWPGNVRELENVIKQCVIDATEDFITDRCFQFRGQPHLKQSIENYYSFPFQEAKDRHINEFENNYIRYHLKINNGNVEACARQCGKHRSAMWALLKKHHINPAEYRY